MEIPRWVVIRRVGDRPKLDPVNFVAFLPLEEVETVLREDGWRRALMQDVAELDGERPVLTLEKPLDRCMASPAPSRGGVSFKLLFATSVVCLSLSRLGLGRILRRS